MKNDTAFVYRVEVEWGGGRRANVQFPDLPTLEVVPPGEFGGPESGWTPERLYIGAVASCFMLTFLALAERSGLELANVDLSASGKLEKAEAAGYRFTEVTIKPTVVVRRIEDTDRAERLLRKAEQACFIAGSIKSRVTVVPQVYHRQTAVYPCPTIADSTGHAL